jgi:hypothetical protein
MKPQPITAPKSLADVVSALRANPGKHGKYALQTARAVKRLGKILRRNLSSMQASTTIIDAYLDSIVWQSSGFKSEKAFVNWRALVRKAVRESAVVRRLQPLLQPRDYPDPWKRWIADVKHAVEKEKVAGWNRGAVAAIPSWCAARGILPTEFDDVAARLMAEWWAANGTNPGRRKALYVKRAIAAWNTIASAGVGGGTPVLPPLSRRKCLNIQLDEMPPRLRADIDAYVHHIRNRNTFGVGIPKSEAHSARPASRFDHLRASVLRDVVLDEPVKGRWKPLGPASDSTVSNSLHAIRTVITACVQSGRVALSSSARLADFLGQQQLVDAFAMLERRAIARGDSVDPEDLPGSLHTIASKLTAIARWARVDPSEITAMTMATKSPDINVEAVNAMPADRRAILNEMDRPEMILRWFRASGKLWQRADRTILSHGRRCATRSLPSSPGC